MEDPAYFCKYNASLRIAGVGHLHRAITERTGISPTHIALAGDRPFRSSNRPLVEDLWMLDSPLDRASRWDFHLRWLWEQVGPHAEYFRFVIEAKPLGLMSALVAYPAVPGRYWKHIEAAWISYESYPCPFLSTSLRRMTPNPLEGDRGCKVKIPIPWSLENRRDGAVGPRLYRS